MRKTSIRAAMVVGVLLLVIQVFQPDRTNPPLSGDNLQEHLPLTSRVTGLFRAACFDCHSNQTRWPWYSYVAPVSWLVSGDVSGGRAHLNFSEWGSYDRRKQISRLGAIVDELDEGAMPLPIYVTMHAEAKLSNEDRDSLVSWAEQMRGVLIEEDRAQKDSGTAPE
jgi:hypothetical protein